MPERSVRMLVAQGCIIVVVLASFAGIFIHSAAIGLTAGAALAVFLVLCWRQFTVATWLTVSLCVLLLAAAMLRGIDIETLSRGLERMAFLAALPTIGALTDIGPVLWPESGTYPWPVKVVVLAIAATGITWIVSAFTFPAREQSTRWIVVPVAAALTLATLWLPWVIVSQVGSDSGSKTAIDIIFTTKASAPGIWVARVGIIVIMLVGIAGAILPLTSRRRTVTFVATWLTSSAVAGLVLLCLWLSVRGDAVMAATSSTGQRVAITGFMLIALVWNARLKAARSPYADDVMEHSGIIPIIMTSEPPRSRQYRADRAIAS